MKEIKDMKEIKELKHIVKVLRIGYVAFWCIPLLILMLGETNVLPLGIWVGNASTAYIANTIGILCMAFCVPMSLKIFSWVLTHKIDKLPLESAVRQYVLWNYLRLSLLELPVILNLVFYYLTMNNTGGLCTLIALVASFFCLPGESKVMTELHLDIKDNQNSDQNTEKK